MRIAAPAGFSFQHTVESHGWYLLAPFRWSRTEQVLRRPEFLDEQVVDLEVRCRRGSIEVTASSTGIDTSLLRERMVRMLQLDVDTAEFAEIARESAAHAWVAEVGFGRLLCGTTLFEDAVKIIATTNTTWRQTVRMVELLVDKCGVKTKSGYAAFPSPAGVARFSIDELQRDCRLGYRAKSIHSLATGIASGAIDLAQISDASQTTEGLFSSYRTLPGIGPYGAAHLLAMDGRHDFIAVDSEFRRFVRETYHRGRKVSDAAMLRRYSKWGRWKYLAYWSELWKSVAERLQPKSGGDK
ncbi:MAG: DNA-3-methyladenine glycosylase family protein [Thermoanaerobaculia bacterium]